LREELLVVQTSDRSTALRVQTISQIRRSRATYNAAIVDGHVLIPACTCTVTNREQLKRHTDNYWHVIRLT